MRREREADHQAQAASNQCDESAACPVHSQHRHEQDEARGQVDFGRQVELWCERTNCPDDGAHRRQVETRKPEQRPAVSQRQRQRQGGQHKVVGKESEVTTLAADEQRCRVGEHIAINDRPSERCRSAVRP